VAQKVENASPVLQNQGSDICHFSPKYAHGS